MKTIWKFVLSPGTKVVMPKGAEPLYVAAQYDQLTMWARVDPTAPLEDREFEVAGTGHDVSGTGRYIGSALLAGGGLVLHVFESTGEQA